MRSILFLFFCVGLLYFCKAQPFNIGHRQITFIDAERNNRPILTEIYYPASTDGDDVPVSGAPGESYPVLAFGHGFVMEWAAYSNIWNTLVSVGYIMAFPRTETGISPDHLIFAQDLAYIIRALQEEGRTVGSPFFERVDSLSCVMGHSMGGGSSFLAVQFNDAISGVVNFAAAETNPSAIEACMNINTPVLMFAGANDCITPPDVHQHLMYDALGSDCKALVTITGASHCQFAEQNVLCSFGELTCTPAPEISRAEQHRLVDTLLVPWLEYQLKGKCQASADFQNILTASNEWSQVQLCEPCFPVGVADMAVASSFRVYPMPSMGEFYLKGPSGTDPLTISIYNVDGKQMYHQQHVDMEQGVLTINSGLNSGIYTISIGYHGQVETLKLILQ